MASSTATDVPSPWPQALAPYGAANSSRDASQLCLARPDSGPWNTARSERRQRSASSARWGPSPATWTSASIEEVHSNSRLTPFEGTSRDIRPIRGVGPTRRGSVLRATPQPSTSPRLPDSAAKRSTTSWLTPNSRSECAATKRATARPHDRCSRNHTSPEWSRQTCGAPVSSLHKAPTHPPGTAQCDQTIRARRAS